MPENKFYLSIGRHERYGTDTAIEREDMLCAYLSGLLLDTCLPVCETVYHSPLARAKETARFEALGMGCTHLLEVDALEENAPTFTIRKFINNLLQNTDDNVSYYHFVTHLPVVEKLGLPFLSAGDVCLLTANTWADMLAENFGVQVIHRPEIEAFLWTQFKKTSEDLDPLTSDAIYNLLQNMK